MERLKRGTRGAAAAAAASGRSRRRRPSPAASSFSPSFAPILLLAIAMIATSSPPAASANFPDNAVRVPFGRIALRCRPPRVVRARSSSSSFRGLEDIEADGDGRDGADWTTSSSRSSSSSTTLDDAPAVTLAVDAGDDGTRRGGGCGGADAIVEVAGAASVRTRKRRPKKALRSPPTLAPPPPLPPIVVAEDEDGSPRPPSDETLRSVVRPLVPTSTWSRLSGNEFHVPSSVEDLARTGIEIASRTLASSTDSVDAIEWKPDKRTSKLLSEGGDGGTGDPDAKIRAALEDGEILVHRGRFLAEGHGSHLPLIRTQSVVNMSPKNFASLLMDSTKVRSYNKMSLGRIDEIVFQNGIDTIGGPFGDGETKIVRNRTKPPLSKKLMEFVTMMHSRRLREGEGGVGYLGGGGGEGGGGEGGESTGYVVVSRAVSGGRWGVAVPARGDVPRGGGSGNDDEDDANEFVRSEILLGVNLLRPVPGRPGQTEVTAVTHVNSPSVPAMLAGKVGTKGAVDFVRDIRALCD